MPKCPTCGSDFRNGQCPTCGRNSAGSIKAVNKELQKYSYPLFAGLCGILGAAHYYSPLDSDPLFALTIFILFVPIVLHIVLSVRKRLSSNAGPLRNAYVCSGAVLILLSSVILLNGALDRSPVRPVRTAVICKSISSGRHSTTYLLIVSSWRPGRTGEKLRVSRGTYRSMFVGEPMVVEVHQGLFGLPWYGQVSPAPAG